MSKNAPKISVIIPLYNHEEYIEEAIHSVLSQSYPDFELIIINDGSSDHSEDRVKAISDDRVNYYYQKNEGAPNTLNRGIQLAKGEYLSILNSDDVYYPDRLKKFLSILESDESIHAVFSHLEFVDHKGNFIKYKRGAEDNWTGFDSGTSFKGEKNIVLDLLAGNFLVTTSNLFCRKSVFNNLGFSPNLKYAHDYELFLKLCYTYKVFILEEALLKYRIHKTNTVKENEAAVSFEVGLVLANFFLTHDIIDIIGNEDQIYNKMVKFFNSVNTHNADRMIFTMFLFGMRYKENTLLNTSSNNIENPFRKACIDKFQNTINLWHESQKAWNKWSETNQRLIDTDQRLSEATEEKKKWWLNSQEAWAKVEEASRRIVELEQGISEVNEEAGKWHLNSQEAWAKVEELNKRLIATEQQLSEAKEETKQWLRETWGRIEETGQKLIATEQQLSEAKEETKEWLRETWGRIEETGQKLITTEQKISEANEEAKKWQLNSQEAWVKVEEIKQKLITTEQKISEANEEAKKWRLNSQEAWATGEEIKQKLIATEQKISEASEEAKKWWLNSQEAWAAVEEIKQKFIATEQEIASLRNSRSFRLGRALTWPLRQLLLKR